MQHVIVDLEATCWDDSTPRVEMETIEIGAVRLDDGLAIIGEFDTFVRPVVHATLSPFCGELTSITQADVESADTFPAGFERFRTWIGDDDYRLCSWGYFDLKQLRLDCDRHGLEFPEVLEERHINLKQEFASLRGEQRCGMDEALDRLGLVLEGTHHRGIDDARNIARIARWILSDEH